MCDVQLPAGDEVIAFVKASGPSLASSTTPCGPQERAGGVWLGHTRLQKEIESAERRRFGRMGSQLEEWASGGLLGELVGTMQTRML